MQNFGHFSSNLDRPTSILTELSGGNAELGEAFALILNDMVVQSGITNPQAEEFILVPDSWRALAKKENKTPEDIKKLDSVLFEELDTLSKSYLLYIAKETKNTTGKLNYAQYEAFLMKYRFGHYDVMNNPAYIANVKSQIKTAFDKIASCGNPTPKIEIDKFSMMVYLYALFTKSRRDANNKFVGFKIDGILEPEEYAINEHFLFEPTDNMFSIKLRTAYRVLSENWRK